MNIPSIDAVCQKIVELIEENTDPPKPLTPDAPLVAELGLESLDIIEMGFSVQETFDFDFSDINPIEELDKLLGGNRLLAEGRLTDEGKRVALGRMPELEAVELPEELTIHKLQEYFTIRTFARLIDEFYRALPEKLESGEPVIIRDFRPCTESGAEVPLPKADSLVMVWVEKQAELLRTGT
ncbi:MAG: phosphopantetheine-binding protein [Acidobacteriota bacterium]|nr:phosphopantetheine-binding protein [Acidobacteriota bacterium]